MKKKYWVEAIVKLGYYSYGNKKGEEKIIEQIEEGELEVMLDEEHKDELFVSNQICRFKEVEVLKIKAKEVMK